MFMVTPLKLNMTFETLDQFSEFWSQIHSTVKATEK